MKNKAHKYSENNSSFLYLFLAIPVQNMSFLPHFRLPPTLRKHMVTTGPNAPLEPFTCLNFCVDDRSSHGNILDARFLASSRSKGSFNWDWEHSRFSLEWANYAEFEMWRQVKEPASSIEFIVLTSQNDGILWSQWKLFICGHQDSRGVKEYEKSIPKGNTRSGSGNLVAAVKLLSSSITTHQPFWDVM